MKKNTITKTTFLTLLVAGAIVALSNLSGCTDILGIDTDYKSVCEWKATIEGPDEIFFDACEPLDVQYELFVDGQPLDLNDVGVWNISGDLDVISVGNTNPVVVRAKEINDVSGVGFGLITFSAETRPDECETAEGGSLLLATKNISIFPNKLSIESNLCYDGSTNLASGTLTLIDKAPGAQNYTWTIAPAGIADIDPQPNSPFCKVKNAKGNFTVWVEKTGSKCVSEVKADIEINCTL